MTDTETTEFGIVEQKIKMAELVDRFVPLVLKERHNKQLQTPKLKTLEGRFRKNFVARWKVVKDRSYLKKVGLDKYDPSAIGPCGFFIKLKTFSPVSCHDPNLLSKTFEAASISCEEAGTDLKEHYKLEEGWNINPGFQHDVAEARKQLQNTCEELAASFMNEEDSGQLEKHGEAKDTFNSNCETLLIVEEAMPVARRNDGQVGNTGTASDSSGLVSSENQKILQAAQKLNFKRLAVIRVVFDDMKRTVNDEFERMKGRCTPRAPTDESPTTPAPHLASEDESEIDSSEPAPMETSSSEATPTIAPAPAPAPAGSPPSSSAPSLTQSTIVTSGATADTTDEDRSGPAPSRLALTSKVGYDPNMWERPCNKTNETYGGDAKASIYGELTRGSVTRLLHMVADSLQAKQKSQDGDTTIATPVSILDIGAGTMRFAIQAAFERGWNAAGFENSANRVLLGAANCLAANKEVQKMIAENKRRDPYAADVSRQSIGRIATVMGDALNASDFNGFDVVYIYDEGFVPSLMEHIGNCWNNSNCKVQFIISTKTWGERLDKMMNNEGELVFRDLKLVDSDNMSKRFSRSGNTAYLFQRTEEDKTSTQPPSTSANKVNQATSPVSQLAMELKNNNTFEQEEAHFNLVKEGAETAFNNEKKTRKDRTKADVNDLQMESITATRGVRGKKIKLGKEKPELTTSSTQKKSKSTKSRTKKKLKSSTETKLKADRKILLLGMVTTLTANANEGQPLENQALRDSNRIEMMKQIQLKEKDDTTLTVCTVSLEAGDKTLHLEANFCHRRFPGKVQEHFQTHASGGPFEEIFLDYSWTPSSWTANRWSRPFFKEILGKLSDHDILTHDGVVYLPCTAYVFKCVMTYEVQLLKNYNISFVPENDFKKLLLVQATKALSLGDLAGKDAASSEELYCTTDLAKIREEADSNITEGDLVDYFGKIKNAKDVRLIKLTRHQLDTEERKGKGKIFFGTVRSTYS
jgi:hypothetical protein